MSFGNGLGRQQIQLLRSCGAAYINAADCTAIARRAKPLEPLAVRVNSGDCVNVALRNRLPAPGISGRECFAEIREERNCS